MVEEIKNFKMIDEIKNYEIYEKLSVLLKIMKEKKERYNINLVNKVYDPSKMYM